MTTLVVRLSSLGDIVLAGSVTGALGDVTFVTHPRYRSLAALLPGVTEAIGFGEDPLPAQADRIIDLHASWRSRQICRRVRGPVRRVRRHDLRRRARVWLKSGAPPPPVVARYAEAAGVTPRSTPWLEWSAGDALLLCPTAAHATKQWPLERYTALGRRWGGPVVVLGGPADTRAVRTVSDGIGSRAEAIAETGFRRTLEAVAGARAAVGGDTGLMHLCHTAGMPAVVLFGPTTRHDGFWPGATAASVPLACRPCSRHGGAACPIGDHRCMQALDVETVWSRLQEVLA